MDCTGTESGLYNPDTTNDISIDNDTESDSDTNNIFSRKIFVGNISYRIGRRELTEFFTRFGEVEHCYLVQEHTRRRRKGIGFITFREESSFTAALGASDLWLDGRELRVQPAEASSRLKLQLPHTPLEDVSLDMDALNHESLNTDCSLHSLNDDTLIVVFTFLSFKDRVRYERVCKRWSRLLHATWLQTRSLHFRGIFSGFKGLSNNILMSVLSKGCRNLVCLDISASVRQLTEKALEIIGHYCSDLEQLNIAGLEVTNISVELLAKRCTKLQWLNVEKCYMGEKAMWWVFHQCKRLGYVNLRDNSQFTGQCFHMLGSDLHTVLLSHCSQLRDVGVEKMSERSEGLRVVHLSNCWQLTGAALKSMAHYLTKLSVLHISGLYNSMTKEDFLLISSLISLEELNVSSNRLASDELLHSLSVRCLRLTTLDLTSCHQLTSQGFCHLGALPLLHMLSVSYDIEFADMALQHIAMNNTLVNLTARACVRLSDLGLSSLAQHCHILQKLDISSCEEITNQTLSELCMRGESDQVTPLLIVLGGTNINTERVTVPPWMTIDHCDYSQMRLRVDREIYIQPEDEYGVDDDDDEDTHSYSAVDELLDMDDPLDMEEFELS